jgi:hypothetical protein
MCGLCGVVDLGGGPFIVAELEPMNEAHRVTAGGRRRSTSAHLYLKLGKLRD